MNWQLWPLPIYHMGLFSFSLTCFDLCCFLFWQVYPVCKKKKQVSECNILTLFFFFFPRFLLVTQRKGAAGAEMAGPCFHAAHISNCSVLQQPALVAATQIQHSPLTRRKRPSYSRTSPWEQTDNYLEHRRGEGEKTSPLTACFTSICKSHLQENYSRKIQCSQLAGKIPEILWFSALQQLGLGLKFKLTLIPCLEFHFVPQSKISCIIVCI